MKYVYILLLTIPMNIECMLIRATKIHRFRTQSLQKKSRFSQVRPYNGGHPLNDPYTLQKQFDDLRHAFICMTKRIEKLEKDQDILFHALKETIVTNDLMVKGNSFISDYNMHYTNSTQPAKE
jgi:hypothetical protein